MEDTFRRAVAVCGVEFRILGPVEVRLDGADVRVGGPKQRALLAFLLLSANRVVSRDRLVAELVPEQDGTAAARALTVQVSRLRKTLSSIDDAEPRLVARPPGYVLRVEPDELDLHTFERLVAEGRRALERGDPGHAVNALSEAESLWRGRPLADLEFEPFARLEVERLEELRLAAAEERFDAELELGHDGALVPELEALAARHPLRERLRGQLMLALYRSGRQADALRVYRDARREVVEELGIEPGQALRELESQILRQDDALHSPAALSDSRALTVGSDRAVQLSASHDALDARAASAPQPRSKRPLLIGAAALVAAGALGAALAAGGGSSRSKTASPNEIAVIDPRTNAVGATAAVGTRPGALVAGSGAVWVANLGDRTITRVDPGTKNVMRTIPVAVEVAGLAAGRGSIWYTTSRGQLSRIEPAYGSTAHLANLGEHNGRFARPVRPAAIGFGSAWVVDPAGLVARVNPTTGKVSAKIQVGTNATAIVAGEGAVWVASPLDDTVSQIDPTNAVTTIRVGHGPSGIAVGAGAVWVTDRYDDTVQRIDPQTGSVVTTIPVGSSPDAVAVAAGAVWIADSHDGTVARIDPATNKVVRRIPVGGTPTAVAAVRGKPWVTVAASAPVGAMPSADVARFTLQTDLSSPDPALAFDFASWQIERSVCALLASYPERQGPQALVARPELARSVTHSADGKTWTFELRRGVRFSPPSHEQVSALTVKRSFERAFDPRMRGAAAYVLPSIAGEPAFLAGKARHISGIVADGYRLTIRLVAPTPDLLARLAVPYFCVVPSNTPVDPNGVASIPSAGPYYVASYDPDQELVLRRNPNYRGPRPSHLAEIVYAIGIGQGQGEAMVQHGQSDYAVDGPPAADQQRLLRAQAASSKAPSRVRFFAYPSLTVRYLALNTRRPLFAHARLRRAVSYAIDRSELARILRRTLSKRQSEGGEPTDSYLPPGVPGGPSRHLYPFHADARAARGLARNVHATAVLYTCNTAPCPQVAAVLASELGRIGIRLRVKAFPLGVLYEQATSPNAPYDILTYGWAPDWLDPSNVLGPFLDTSAIGTPNNANFANFADPRYATRFAAALRLYPPERYRAFARLTRDLERQSSPLVAYSADASYNLFSSRVGCQLYQPLYGIDLGALCVRS